MKHLLQFAFSAILFISAQNLSGQACIILSSGAGSNSQTVCMNTPITQIRYTLASGVTGVTVTGLPAGVTFTFTTGLLTIDGTPSVSGNFTYNISVTGTCSGSPTASGTITVNPLPVPTLTSSEEDNIFCAGTSVTFTAGGGVSYTFRVNSAIVQSGASNIYITSNLTNGQTVDVIVTNTFNCSATSSGITNIVNPVPTAAASNNGPVCPGTELRLTGGPGGMIAYTWSGPNGYSSGTRSPVVSTSATPAMAGIYTLTVTNNYGCQDDATTNVVVRTPPAATAANNGPVCVGSPLNLTGGPGSMSSYAWTGPNGFNSTQRSPLVSSSATLAMAGTYTLTVTDSNGCTNSASTVVVVNALPPATAASNSPVCIGTQLTLTGGPSGMGTYSWTGPNGFTSSQQNPVVSSNATLAMAGIYTLTVTNATTGCTNSASTTVVINSLPVATASNNSPVCIGSTLTLAGGPSGMSAYSWVGPDGFTSTLRSPTVSSNATAAMAGIYILTVTNANGCQGIATTNVTINPLPSATASNNGPVCVGTPLILAGGPSGMTSYSWTGPNGFISTLQSPVVSLSASAAMAGTYTLNVINSNGCHNSSTTTAVVNPLPVPVASNNGPVCAGASLILTGGPTGMTTYSWTGPNGFISTLQSPVVSQTATALMAGAYTLTVTNNNGCQNSTFTTVVVNASPVATASNNGPVCVGAQLSLTGGPAGMSAYSWSGPNSFTSNLQSPVVSPSSSLSMAGVYTLTVTASSGCQDTATTRAYIYQLPVANAGTGGIECDLDFILNAVPSIGTGVWSMVTGPGTATFAPNANTPTNTVTVSTFGTYTFRWTETNGPCTSNAVVTVNFYQPPVANPGTGGDECDLNFNLNAIPSSGTGSWSMINGTGSAAFAPNANSPVAVVTVTENGTKIFMWKEENGNCADSANITVNFYQQPLANAGTGGNNCGLNFNLGAIPSIGTGTWTRISGPGTATFTPNSNLPTARVTVSAHGVYVFRWTELNGICSNSDEISVSFIQQPEANGGNGGKECDLTFVLNAVPGAGTGTWSKSSGPGNATFTPNPNQPNATVTVTQFGAYDFAWTESNSQCSSSDIVRVEFYDLPAVNAGTDVAICRGRNIQLNATGNGTFLWAPANLLNNPAIANPVATPTVTTLFTVTLTATTSGCKNTDQINVEVRPQPIANAGPDQELAFTFETTLEAAVPGSNQTGEWTLLAGRGEISDINDPASIVSDLGLDMNSFIWTVTNGVCPVSADTVTILVRDLKIPTLITPNEDGNNDYFVINGIETLGKCSLTVFNRWGGRVFENPGYNNKWNGLDENDKPLPEDTYFFILKTEKNRSIKGYIVIRR